MCYPTTRIYQHLLEEAFQCRDVLSKYNPYATLGQYISLPRPRQLVAQRCLDSIGISKKDFGIYLCAWFIRVLVPSRQGAKFIFHETINYLLFFLCVSAPLRDNLLFSLAPSRQDAKFIFHETINYLLISLCVSAPLRDDLYGYSRQAAKAPSLFFMKPLIIFYSLFASLRLRENLFSTI